MNDRDRKPGDYRLAETPIPVPPQDEPMVVAPNLRQRRDYVAGERRATAAASEHSAEARHRSAGALPTPPAHQDAVDESGYIGYSFTNPSTQVRFTAAAKVFAAVCALAALVANGLLLLVVGELHAMNASLKTTASAASVAASAMANRQKVPRGDRDERPAGPMPTPSVPAAASNAPTPPAPSLSASAASHLSGRLFKPGQVKPAKPIEPVPPTKAGPEDSKK